MNTPTANPLPVTLSAAHYWMGWNNRAGALPRYLSSDLGPASYTTAAGVTKTRDNPPARPGRAFLQSETRPTDAQWDAAFGVSAADAAKAIATATAQAALAAEVALGIDCSSAIAAAAGTLILPINPVALTLMTQLLTLWQEADLQSTSTLSTRAAMPWTVQDTSGKPHALTIAQTRQSFTAALAGYFSIVASSST